MDVMGKFTGYFQLQQVSQEIHERLRTHLQNANIPAHLLSVDDANEGQNDAFSSFNDADVTLSKVEESSAEKPQDSCI